MQFGPGLGHMGMDLVHGQIQDDLKGYLLRGWEPGAFLTSMLAMDLQKAIVSARNQDRHQLWAVGEWIIHSAPTGSWGSYQAVQDWCQDLNEQRTKWTAWYRLQHRHTLNGEYPF